MTRSLLRLAERHSWKCFYCGIHLRNHEHLCTRDHVVPKSKGGRNRDNLVLACVACNKAKKALAKDEFVQGVATGKIQVHHHRQWNPKPSGRGKRSRWAKRQRRKIMAPEEHFYRFVAAYPT